MNRQLRRIINKSSKQCCQICEQQEILVEHHINGRNVPNFNKSFNLAAVCPNCHNKVHHGKIIIEKWVQTSKGLKLIFRNMDEVSITGETATPPLY